MATTREFTHKASATTQVHFPGGGPRRRLTAAFGAGALLGAGTLAVLRSPQPSESPVAATPAPVVASPAPAWVPSGSDGDLQIAIDNCVALIMEAAMSRVAADCATGRIVAPVRDQLPLEVAIMRVEACLDFALPQCEQG